MVHTWWILWWAVLTLFLISPVGRHAWGYRGWGVPYPRYVQRRRLWVR